MGSIMEVTSLQAEIVIRNSRVSVGLLNSLAHLKQRKERGGEGKRRQVGRNYSPLNSILILVSSFAKTVTRDRVVICVTYICIVGGGRGGKGKRREKGEGERERASDADY